MQSNKIYIDYLDYSVSKPIYAEYAVNRLKFDLLLFPEETKCLSVPACVKLDSTAQLLMQLTPFWNDGIIQLVLDRKHGGNPWNYFNKRKKMLEKAFCEENLRRHFEYISYTAGHTQFFYDTYIKEFVHPKQDLYIGKVFDTDVLFRRAVVTKARQTIENVCAVFPVQEAIHAGKILNDLTCMAEDYRSFFQREAVRVRLQEESRPHPHEMQMVNHILDIGFSYANGMSCYAAPISKITNRLTGKQFMPILAHADRELYAMLCALDFGTLYRLSMQETWLDFVDHLNRLLILYQSNRVPKKSIYPIWKFPCSRMTERLVDKVYDTAMEAIKKELFLHGTSVGDILRFQQYSDAYLEALQNLGNGYWGIIKEMDAQLKALKTIIPSIKRKYRGATRTLQEEGFYIECA